MRNYIITPPAIRKGDTIAIISPATEVKAHWVRGAVAELKRRGYKPMIMPHSLGPRHGTFAANDTERLADLREALLNPEVKAILCARGGYGCIQLISKDLQKLVSQYPKWIIGFSDISALHALWQKAGVKSLHCSMAKQLTLFDIDFHESDIVDFSRNELPTSDELPLLKDCVGNMFDILEGNGDSLSYSASSPEGIICGETEGVIVGGNLAVLNGLASTPWDILDKEFLRGKILFLEDIGEKIYQVERMLTRLHLAGAFENAAGIIFGQFTEYYADRNFSSMEEMIASRIREWNVKCPVALSFPIGHTAINRPIPEGAAAHLNVTPDHTRLTITIM